MPRAALSLVLLASLAVAGPPLQVVGKRDDVGTVKGVAAVAIGEGYLPFFFNLRQEGIGHVRVVDLDMGTRDEGKLSSRAAGLARLGDAVVLASQGRGGALEFRSMRYAGHRMRSRSLGTVDVSGLRVLRLTSTTTEPVLVATRGNQLRFATPRPRKEADVQDVDVGGAIAAVSPIYRTARGVYAVAGVTTREQVFRVERHRDRWGLVALRQADCAGFKARDAAVLAGRLVLAGAWKGRASLVAVDLGSIRRAGRNPLRRLLPVALAASADLGAGEVGSIAVLDGSRLAVGGTKSGRAWAGVVEAARDLRLANEAYFRGTMVGGLGVNPARKGWTFAVQTDHRRQYLLRHPKDPALPRDWDPFPRPEPERPKPEPEPEPERPEEEVAPPPVRVPDRAADAAPARPGRRGPDLAVLPRVAADERARRDTKVVVINLAKRRVRATLRFVDNDGRVRTSTTMRLRPGERIEVSALQELKAARIASFDGWVRIDGCARRETVVDAVRTGPRGLGLPVTVHWR